MGKYLDIAKKFEAERQVEQQEAPAVQSQQGAASNRSFLSRPLGQENNPDPWDAWAPFMGWLFAEHPARFHAVCEAEEAIRELEQQGVTAGEDYEQACATLLRVFEEAREAKFRETVKVWIQ